MCPTGSYCIIQEGYSTERKKEVEALVAKRAPEYAMLLEQRRMPDLGIQVPTTGATRYTAKYFWHPTIPLHGNFQESGRWRDLNLFGCGC
jgi:hypothetical protein